MASFLFVAAEERFYPALGTMHPGDTWEGDENPDPPHFDEVGGTSEAPIVVDTPAPVADEPAQEG